MTLDYPLVQSEPVVADRPWLDSTLTAERRIELLLAEMTVEEKAGLLFLTPITATDIDETNSFFGTPPTRDYVEGQHMTHFCVMWRPST